MHVLQNFNFARIFSPCKKVEVVYTLSPLVTGKKLLVSLAFVTSSKQSFEQQELKFDAFSECFSVAFQNTLLQQIVEMPDLSGHGLYNFNTLGDKNESATGSTQIAAPSPTPLTPCTSTIKDIETLINKVQDFPILWDKSCAEYKNALKKNYSRRAQQKK